jgi:CheY-like chemotaxis protein
MGEGTGLGLAVVHGIMTKLGGYIDVQSRQGEGTRFDLFFPVYQETDESEKPQNTVVVSGEERVMFVDDEPYLVEIGQKMLEKLGYRVETFMDPLKALEAFRKDPHAYDLVITDKSMPHMNGQNLAVALRAIRPDLPIVISSGYHDKKNPETHSNLSRPIIYIDKPLRYADLAKVIREILD